MKMKMKSNYDSVQWIEFFVCIGVIIVFMIVPTYLYVDFILIPVLDAHIIFLKYVDENDILNTYTEYVEQNDNLYTDETIAAVIVHILAILLFLPFLLVLPIIWLIPQCCILGIWVCKKTQIYPLMNPVVFYKGKGYTLMRFKP